MPSIKILQEPGHVYDLLFLFNLHFNMEFHLTSGVIKNKSESDENFFHSIDKHFAPFAEELKVFFHTKADSTCFMTEYYYHPYSDHMTKDYDFNFLLAKLNNHEQIISNILTFYFPELGEKEREEFRSNILIMSETIDGSVYDDSVKSRLYSFFINPDEAITTLIRELCAKERTLEKYRESNMKTLTDTFNSFDAEKLATAFDGYSDDAANIREAEAIYVSMCLVCKNCVHFSYEGSCCTVTLGYDYIEWIAELTCPKNNMCLGDLGDILAEKNRVDIVDYLFENGEVTIKQIEEALNLTCSTAYYHLAMMVRIGMVNTGNRGRTVLYSLNGKYFSAIIGLLRKYI